MRTMASQFRPAVELSRVAAMADPVCNVAVPPESCAENGGSMIAYGDATRMKGMILFVPLPMHESLERSLAARGEYLTETLDWAYTCLEGYEGEDIPTDRFAGIVACIFGGIRSVIGHAPLGVLLADPGVLFARRDFGGVQFSMLDEFKNLFLYVLPHQEAFA